MSEYDDLLHSAALKFVAEMSGLKGDLKKYTGVFFDKLAREVFSGREEMFGRAEFNKLLIKIEGFVDELIDKLSDKVIVAALKHMQLLSCEIRDARRIDEVAEELFRTVKDPAEHYRLVQRARELEARIEAMKKAMGEYESHVKEFLARDEKYRVLVALGEAGGGSYSDLAEKLHVSKAKLMRYVKELEEAGLVEVERSKSPHLVRVKSVPWRLNLNLGENGD
ncbi:MAG: MarR family transcriptional regulator [Candidatus Freyarchaeota archaeon]|nr:MarR family transcriptional regulator [Candidatus Jordarchaeia archaeon]